MPLPLSTSVARAVHLLLEDLSTPVSLKVKILIDNGEWDQLASLAVDPRHYLDAESYWRDAMASNIIRKLPELPTSFNRQVVAEDSFVDSERKCLRANRRLYALLSLDPGIPEGVYEYFSRARKIIKKIIGSCPDTDKVLGRFGPGSTYGDRGSRIAIPDKMSSSPTLTTSAIFYGFPWMSTLWHPATVSAGKSFLVVPGNRFTTVPKDCTKHRGIAVEPSINSFFQLGYGRVLRSRLRGFGINLDDGQDIHKRVACEASSRGHLCTIDLSSASDTVSRNLVKLLLPTRWFSVLDDLRSHKTLFKGNWWLLEKFSSMGNGFTFELETLVFLALVLACDPTGHKLVPGRNVFVFGDDIIFPSEFSKEVIATLSFSGLTVNESKSFVDGPFRESCGGDYFEGVDVRPHFLKESPCEPQQLIALANGLRRACKGIPTRLSTTRRSWFCVIDALPSRIRDCRGPSDLGDLLLHDEESRWRPRWRSSIRYFRVYRPAKYRSRSWKGFSPEVTLASAVYGVPWNNGRIIGRDSVAGYKLGWAARS